MAKRFKLRICRAITATWQSCRSKDPSILPEDPALSFSRLNADDQDRRRGGHRRQSFKHHASSAFISIGAACGLQQTSDEEFKWQKEEKWHVVAKMYEQPPTHRRKICNSSASEDDLPFLPPAPPPSSAEENYCRGKRKNKKKKKNKYRNVPSRLRTSTSSAESGWFSSDGGAASAAAAAGEEHYREETGTLVSSAPSLSTTDTTSSNSHKIKNKRRVISSKRRGVVSWPPPLPSEEVEIPARLSMLKKLIPCAIDGKVKESFAVVKRSENPYEDFKNSMMDMITEKQMFDHRDLEQLLQCFLSLNSGNYHGIIVQVFSDIWNDIFSPAAGLNFPQHRRRRVSRIASF
ncbi:hypothetical protein ABFS82_08G074800 [Erythranthe guttata]|uniref:transcription repressor OFP7-like n=1 Tax=Erythranthe guttata TaxID=4155 RepID=UPI00064DC696|nr:PREDICTED: transcription repressor OFP7-like [Erythranthe guttata]|eukprot:XP_012834058.1 PREDICTED: transcription repressor OFP7-like [Erythranthe guttata]